MGAQDEERRAAAVREMWPKGMSKLTRKAKAVRGAAVAVLACVLAAAAFFGVAQNAGGLLPGGTGSAGQAQSAQGSAVDWHSLADLPAYAGEPYVELEGNRPSFTEAGAPDEANRLYEWFVERARRDVPRVETGRFGAYMDVSLTNDGPFTLWLDTDAL